MTNDNRIVVGVTGASGSMYAVRLLQVLIQSGLETHLVISPSGAAVIKQELGLTFNIRDPDLEKLICCIPSWSSRPAFIEPSTVSKRSDHGNSVLSSARRLHDTDRKRIVQNPSDGDLSMQWQHAQWYFQSRINKSDPESGRCSP